MADLIYEVHNHLARITLNRPKQLNCFSEEMIRLWTEALEDVRDNDDVYALLLSGNGKAFCAGGDVKAMAPTAAPWILATTGLSISSKRSGILWIPFQSEFFLARAVEEISS